MPDGIVRRCDLDSHADTSVAGSGFILLGEPSRFVTVHGYTPERAPIPDVPLGTTATVWINPATGQSYLFVLHQSLFFGDRMPNSLLCPNQLRCNGLIVNECPKQFSGEHCIVHPTADLTIPLFMSETSFSYFETLKPTADDLENAIRVELTLDTDWCSHKQTLSENEPYRISALHSTTLPTVADATYPSAEYFPDDLLHDALISCVRVEASPPSLY